VNKIFHATISPRKQNYIRIILIFFIIFVLYAGATGNDNDCRTTIACSGISGSEPLANSAFCSKPEDEMEKLSHRSNSSLGVVSIFFSKNNGSGTLKVNHGHIYIIY